MIYASLAVLWKLQTFKVLPNLVLYEYVVPQQIVSSFKNLVYHLSLSLFPFEVIKAAFFSPFYSLMNDVLNLWEE